ncbi:MAG: hypothetical protein RIS70_543 [Planctomycetota bacterium]
MTTRVYPQGRGKIAFFSAIAFGILFTSCSLFAQEAEWIWSPEHEKEKVPQTTCYFRKAIQLQNPNGGKLTLAADDTYELQVNGRTVASGSGHKKLVEYDITKYLTAGRNIVAIKASNTRGNTAAVVARLIIRDSDGQWRSYSSDKTWKTNLRPLPLWETAIYNDSRWQDAQSFGPLGQTTPWDRADDVAKEEVDRGERFNIGPEFSVQRVISGEETGSLIAMSFNEFGMIIASREGGPLLLMYDSDNDQVVDKTRVYCDLVKNCQGILPLNGEVFVTGDGPDGAALYRLRDTNRDGKLDDAKAILKFKGEMREHGPHAITLGPDGFLYVVVGNLVSLENPTDDASPLQKYYEGDLVGRYEDPGGHAVGVKAPGGVVVRLDIEAKSVQVVAGGLRNVYDVAFNRAGDMFAHDSDMETDEGTPWFRPTQLFHVTPGSDLGWRSGWARWSEYFLDCVPPMLDTGRGSPTGSVVYSHFAFPSRYQDALFLADWADGRILVTRLKPTGSSYTASTEVFLQGHPLNITDLEVGPEGGLYFITGGRGTGGGLYRVVWKGQVPPAVSNLGTGIAAAIRQPQLNSAWSRQQIAKLRTQVGASWDKQVEGVARSTANPPAYRMRALDIMQLFGPTPTPDLLISLSADKSEQVRAKAVDLMGIISSDATQSRLVELLKDSDHSVRRKACEALLRAEQTIALQDLLPILESDDRFESTAARKLLERLPLDSWKNEVLTSTSQRVAIQGCLALAIVDPSPENTNAIIGKCQELMKGFVSDRNFVDLLRVMQVAIHLAPPTDETRQNLLATLSEEYPSGNDLMNRELVRLLVGLQCDGITERFLEQLKSDKPEVEKLHLAMHMRFLESGWEPGQRLQWIDYCEKAIKPSSESNYPLYLKNLLRDFARTVTEEEGREILSQGVKWPNAALGALYKLPAQLDATALEDLKKLDKQIAAKNDDVSKPLRVGIVAVLARSGDPDSMEYLREIWRRDPDRRATVAMGLAQQPDGDNWDYLVRSLSLLEGAAATEVLAKLATVDQAPDEAICYREVIMRGLELKDHGADRAVALLEHWAESPVSSEEDTWANALKKWQDWFSETYPDQPEAKLPESAVTNKYDFFELLEYLTTGNGARNGSNTKGVEVFAKAQCAKCHRIGDRGERIGPDLSNVTRRFTKKELLSSIYYPSHVISDQFAAQVVATTSGRQYVGIVAAGGAGEKVILQSNGEKITIRDSEIAQTSRSNVSSMPEGLLNSLSQEEIADLFAFLAAPPGQSVSKRESENKAK